jgi:carbonic anhydrase
MSNTTKSLAAFYLLVIWCLFTSSYANHQPQDTPAKAHDAKIYWGYEGDVGPDAWGLLSPQFAPCAEGMKQSPINITQSTPQDLPDIDVHYQPTDLNIINNGHTVEVRYDQGSYVSIGGIRYELERFHFHVPSEHRLEGAQYAMEMHLVHKSSDKGAGGKQAVIAVMMNSLNSSSYNQALAPVWNYLPTVPCIERHVADVKVNARDLLPQQRDYFQYEGSLTTPPCDEEVAWFVLKTPVEVSPAQVAAVRAIIRSNSRPVQPLNGRPVLSNKPSS